MGWERDLSKRALALRVVGIGWYIAFCLILGTLGGYWLDRHVDNTFPIFTLIGVTLGLVVAMVGLFLMVRPLMKEGNKTDKEDD
ncbi:MAG TPA: AtpZ/AtpI family protein [Dehalococcoidia bacterium]|nr:AtpZ/AtpI family protein [Dehalococcoidia bacterium]